MLRLFSPAKINLFLRIVSKRSDGYHDLSSIFQTVSLGDVLEIERDANEELTCTDPSLPIDASNLVLKATALFRRKTGMTQRFKMHLVKRIPTQAGLGGGSSNAATTLWACNQLTHACIPTHALQEWSSEIGSDVPFFFSAGRAYCTGRGDTVHSIPLWQERSVWIVKPQKGLSTPDVFRCLNFTNDDALKQAGQSDLPAFLSGSLPYFNDLEQAAFKINPELNQLKISLLEQGFETVMMSGSGSAFFCLGHGTFPRREDLTLFPVRFIYRTLSDWYPL